MASARDDYAIELARRRGARQPATFSEILSSTWNATGLDTLSGTGEPYRAAHDALVKGVEAATGKTLAELYAAHGVTASSLSTLNEQQNFLRGVIDTLEDDDEKKKLAPLLDVRAAAARRAHEIEREAADVSAATYGLSGNALAFFTGMARQFVDPVNLASAPLGGPLKGPLVKMALREFAIGAGVQAVQEPKIQTGRAELGLEAGPGQAFSNILEAGTGNLVFGLVGRGLTSVYWRAAQAMPALPRPESWTGFSVMGGVERAPDPNTAAPGLGNAPPRQSSAGVTPDDLAAAARVVERDAVLDAELPSQALRTEIPARVDRAAEALNQGRVPFDIEARFETPELYGPPGPAPKFAEGFAPRRVAYADGDVQSLIRTDGTRLAVRPVVMELSDLVVSHNADGVPNPNYPAALQPRDRAAPASRSWTAETAAKLEPELLGRAPTAQTGAPVIGPDGVVESGNGRVMMIARVYDRHPDRAAALREFYERQGYDVAAFEFPVLVRLRETPLSDRAAFAREANVSPVAGMSVRELAFADAKQLDLSLIESFRGGAITDLQNAQFVRAFADRAVAPEERPQFIGSDERLSAAGAQRIEAALVARGWRAEDVVAAIYEEADPNARAILGAFADTAPLAARLRAAIDEQRVPAAQDPVPALLAAWRLVSAARARGEKMIDAVNQIDIERGAVPPAVREAVRIYFRDDALRFAAGRDVVAARIEKALDRALDQQNAVGDLFGEGMTLTANFKAATLAGENVGNLGFDFRGMTGRIELESLPSGARRAAFGKLAEGQPFDTIDEALARAPARQLQLVEALRAALPEKAELKDPGVKGPKAELEEKIARKRYDSPRQLTDIVRAGVVVAKPEDADAISRALASRFRVVDEGWHTTEGGYFDRKLSIVFDDGTVAEVQLWPEKVFAAKKAGHAIYEKRRVSKDPAERAALLTEERAYWAAVLNGFDEAWRPLIGASPKVPSTSPNASLASSSESSTTRSAVTSTALTGSQPRFSESTKASMPETAASLPSQSKNLTPASMRTSEQKVGPEGGKNKPPAPGDAQLRADAERALNEAGGDIEIVIVDPDTGAERRGSARALLKEAEDDAVAAAELKDCIQGGGQ